MGCEFEIWLSGGAQRYLENAAHQAFEELDRLDAQLSHFRLRSELSYINSRAAYAPVTVEPRLFRLLEQAKRYWETTEGAFDIACGALVQPWGFAGGQPRVPAESEIRSAMARSGMEHVHLDAAARTVAFDVEGVMLDLSAIGKGYAVDRIGEFIRSLHLRAAFVQGGGSSALAIGAPPDDEGWPISVAGRKISLRDRAISTTGVEHQRFEHEGRTYHHVLDPRKGRPSEGVLSCTVLADTATEAEALSTAWFVLGAGGNDSLVVLEDGREHDQLRNKGAAAQ